VRARGDEADRLERRARRRARLRQQFADERLTLGARPRLEWELGPLRRRRPGDGSERRPQRCVVLGRRAGDQRVGHGGEQAVRDQAVGAARLARGRVAAAGAPGVAQQIFPIFAPRP
jgi:hypothetical protein